MALHLNWTARAITLCVFVLVHSVFLQATGQRAAKIHPARNLQKKHQGFHFATATSALGIPFELSNNLIMLKVRVNNSRPLNFFLDTGAGVSVIDPRQAKALALKPQGKLTLGATGGSVQSEMMSGVSLALPGVKVFDQPLAAIPLDSFSLVFGERLDGILGYDLLKHFVVEIDYAAGIMNLHDPKTFAYSGSGESIPIKLVDNVPFAHARLLLTGRDPIEGKFKIDTGAVGTLYLNTPFVNKQKLLEAVPGLLPSNLGGAGGLSKSVRGRVKGVQLGSFIIEGPVVSFAQGTQGNEGASAYDGEVGSALFRRFKVILDYSRERMTVEPIAGFIDNEDLSGLEVFAEGADFKTFVVNEVAANSPASEAGLREEDVIVAIDGRPAAGLTLKQIRQMFTQDGKEYVLSVRREKIVQIRIKLRRVV